METFPSFLFFVRLFTLMTHCLECVDRVEKALEAIPGVVATDVELNGVTTIDHENVDERTLMRVVA